MAASFARAFSKRSARPETTIETRSIKSNAKKTMKIGDISLPLNLISTTNMQSYEAPDIVNIRERDFSTATNSSRTSSDGEPSSPTSVEPALTEGSSAGSSPRNSPILEHNHLSAYFPAQTLKRSKSAMAAAHVDSDVPPLPLRAASHSKREHERLSRARSFRSSTGSSSGSPENTPKAPSSEFAATSPLPSIPKVHPFSSELDQLDEVAEDFHSAAHTIEQEQDIAHMKEHGLGIFTPSDYAALVFPSSPFDLGLPLDEDGGWI